MPSGPVGYNDSNLLAVAHFLEQHGYTRAAAAGIAGTIAGESAGDPASVGTGGCGLIGWTPCSVPVGNLAAQEQAILTYNNGNWASSIPPLNAQPTPVAAADFYSANFERPAVTYSDVRPDVANWVYTALRG